LQTEPSRRSRSQKATRQVLWETSNTKKDSDSPTPHDPTIRPSLQPRSEPHEKSLSHPSSPQKRMNTNTKTNAPTPTPRSTESIAGGKRRLKEEFPTTLSRCPSWETLTSHDTDRLSLPRASIAPSSPSTLDRLWVLCEHVGITGTREGRRLWKVYSRVACE
jgi:hypothetical protein